VTDWQERIVSDPAICHGKPTVRGTRVMVSVILDNLADGLSPQEIIEEYPPLELQDVQAAVAYAAELARESWCHCGNENARQT
jgi:uncharacterized protein (DUF433 family)